MDDAKKRAATTDDGVDLSVQGKDFFETFFKKGAEFTSGLIVELEALRKHAAKIAQENIELRHQLASDDAIRELLDKIEYLENEKKKLETILFGIGDSVSVFDLKGNLLLRNPQGKLIQRDQNKALFPLETGFNENIVLDTEDGPRNFEGNIKLRELGISDFQ